MKTLDILFVSALGLTGAAFMFSIQNKPGTVIATAQSPTPQATAHPTPTPTITPSPQPSPTQQTVTQGTLETVSPQTPVDVPVERDNWVARQLGESPEQINARTNTSVYQPVSERSYQAVQQRNYEAPRRRNDRGSGRNYQVGSSGNSMPRHDENPIAFFQRSGREEVWSFGDDNNTYPSQWGLPDRTTDAGYYRDRCLLFDTVCHRLFGNEWKPAPGSNPINEVDPTRNARRAKAVARAINAPFQWQAEQGY